MIAVAGATGYIGRLLCLKLCAEGEDVVALARHPEAAADLKEAGATVRWGDVLKPRTLEPALAGADVAYYLVHSMGRGASDDDFAKRDLEGAHNFAAAAAATGVKRIVYLGGLGEVTGESEHLESRHATAEALREGSVPVVYFRAAAVVGSGSESFRTVYYLVRRLPAMITPRWVTTKTQPIAIDDIVAFLAAARDLGLEVEREIQVGGPDVTTYGGMIDELAKALGRRPPLRLTVPVLSPSLSSHWIGLVTPVDSGVARPLVEGLTTETVVTDPTGMALFPGIERTPLDRALLEAAADAEEEDEKKKS